MPKYDFSSIGWTNPLLEYKGFKTPWTSQGKILKHGLFFFNKLFAIVLFYTAGQDGGRGSSSNGKVGGVIPASSCSHVIFNPAGHTTTMSSLNLPHWQHGELPPNWSSLWLARPSQFCSRSFWAFQAFFCLEESISAWSFRCDLPLFQNDLL